MSQDSRLIRHLRRYAVRGLKKERWKNGDDPYRARFFTEQDLALLPL
jgi:hypothetical protein